MTMVLLILFVALFVAIFVAIAVAAPMSQAARHPFRRSGDSTRHAG